jgi:hypothetical protein
MGKEIKNRTTESGDPTWLDSLKGLVEVILRSKEGKNSFVLTTRLLEKLQAGWNIAAGSSATTSLACVPTWLADFRDAWRASMSPP